MRYQPVSFLTFRGTASTGFRAPTLYDSVLTEFPGCLEQRHHGSRQSVLRDQPPTAPFTSGTCATQGLGLFGGNKNLTPETSQNFDLGVIISPIQDMGITVDYYRILLKNTIGAVPETAIYGDPATFANYYVLNSSGGLTPSIAEASACHPYTQPTCGYILLTIQNTGRITTDGIDISIQYSAAHPDRNVPRGSGRDRDHAVSAAAVQRRARS